MSRRVHVARIVADRVSLRVRVLRRHDLHLTTCFTEMLCAQEMKHRLVNMLRGE